MIVNYFLVAFVFAMSVQDSVRSEECVYTRNKEKTKTFLVSAITKTFDSEDDEIFNDLQNNELKEHLRDVLTGDGKGSVDG